ncbi:hypothetical protein GWA97_00240 [Flavobacterium sp. LaA7.5]|nr:hypothetical protein [Flavobacterium salilacus subsp. altitudinum]
MKKYFVLILFYCFTAYAQNTESNRTENIEKFIKTYLIPENPKVDLMALPSYFYVSIQDIDSLNPKSEQMRVMIKHYILMMLELEHNRLKHNGFNYRLVAHQSINREMLNDYLLVYPNLSNVFYLVSNNKILTHFILDDNNRIISFARNPFGSHGGKIDPFMLNDIEIEN